MSLITINQQKLSEITANKFLIRLEAHYDATAQQRRYDNRYTCALRAGYPGPFQAEGAAFALWMDRCNAACYQIIADVESGHRPPPESFDALLAELPAMEWPE